MPDEFEINGVPTPRFPMLYNPSAGVLEATFPYLRELAVLQRRAPGTVADVARILAIWITHLHNSGRSWDKPCPEDFIRWAQTADEPLTTARRRRRATTVFEFYAHLCREAEASWEVQNFVEELSAPIPQDAFVQERRIQRVLRLRFGIERRPMRPTPTVADIEAIEAKLLRQGDTPVSVRNWLLVRTAFETNLRTHGLAQLTIAHLDQMLRSEGILTKAASLADLLKDARGRADVRAQIDRLEATGRRHFISEPLKEKGRERSVRFPISLMRQLTEFVWSERSDISERTPSNALWISAKTGRALLRGSIADILKEGFRLAGVAGSGHRLRAAHCVRLFRSMVSEGRRNGAGRFDAEAILERVAQVMGHASTDSLRPYLNAVLLEEFVGQET